jgi:hypothetical protein
MSAELGVVNADVLETACDVLVLKYAQRFYGADLAVVSALGLSKEGFTLDPGDYVVLPTNGKIRSGSVLLVGVPPLFSFEYAEIRALASTALRILDSMKSEYESVAMTMHGVGYGLDEREAFTAQVAGLLDYLTAGGSSWEPKKILIVERDLNRSQRIKDLLRSILLDSGYHASKVKSGPLQSRLPDAGIGSESKSHIFVAMPYDDDMEDVYEFGIREPVNQAGCLCERCDHAIFTGDVMERVKDRIGSSTVVIADVTGSNPNVYLEIGYAWGRGLPTLLVARKGEDLKFDITTHKCIFYTNISHLKKQLTQYLSCLLTETELPARVSGVSRFSDKGSV